MIKTIYDKNETMVFLGKQFPMDSMSDETWKQLKDIAEAHLKEKHIFYEEIGLAITFIDAYMLGFIYGKRAERARKRERGQQ